MDVVSDDLRHKREEEARRQKRKEKRQNKTAEQREREARRREHNQRIINEQNERLHKGKPLSKTSPKKPTPPEGSKFQGLFSKRAEGFLIEMNFRNAAPRPPVGPCFVGLGLDGELNDKWTRYKPFNAVEANYAWKLHAEPDLGVPLAPSAMDLEGCYVDPSKPSKKQKVNAYDELFNEDDETDEKQNDENDGSKPLHPDDEALISWKGHLGDSAAEELQRRRDKARTEARQGMNGGTNSTSTSNLTSNQLELSKPRKGFQSRVLKEKMEFFMKKTTYLANDQSQSVHEFKSLAQTKQRAAEEITRKLEENENKTTGKDAIDKSFEISGKNTSKRKHPTKKSVEAMLEIPLLPDDVTWGHTFTHVVLDEFPKTSSEQAFVSSKQLETAYIADVEKGAQNLRLECQFLVSDVDSSSSSRLLYDSIQRYNLDVQPLKEEGAPHSNFLFIVDEEKGTASYHPVSSRVQLSSGRPISRGIGIRTISKQLMDEDDLIGMENRLERLNADDIHAGRFDDVENRINENFIDAQHIKKRQNPFDVVDDSSDSDDGF